LFFTRALYATADTRTPALVNLALVAATSAVMLTAVPQLTNRDLVTGLAGAFAFGNLGGAIALGVLVQRRITALGGGTMAVLAPIGRSVAAAGLAAVLGYGCSRAIGWSDKPVAALGVALSAAVVLVVFVSVNWALGGPSPRLAATSLGAGVER